MGSATVRSGSDTWDNSGAASRNYSAYKYLSVASGSRFAYLWFGQPFPRGATITSATLYLSAYSAQTARTYTVQRVGSKFNMGTEKWTGRPGVTGTAVATAVGSVAANGLVALDVTAIMQEIASGGAAYGLRISSNGAATSFWSLNAASRRPYLVVNWNVKPGPPTDLRPSAGAVSLAKPVLRFTHNDPDGVADLAAFQVQVDPAANGTTPAFDSGAMTPTSGTQLDLAATAYAGLANAATTQWRCRARDALVWSDWSTWATFSRQDKGVLAITAPAASPSNFVQDVTPPIAWTFTGTQTAYRITVASAARPSVFIWDSGRVASTTQSVSMPNDKSLQVGGSYIVTVYVWDNVVREDSTNDPSAVIASRAFTVNTGATGNPTALTATRSAAPPQTTLNWTLATAPDSFTITRDGVVIVSDLLPGDALISGTSYRFVDWTAPEFVAHTYVVYAVVNGVQGSGTSVTTPATGTGRRGLWLLDPEQGVGVMFAGDDAGTWQNGEDAEVLSVLGSSLPIRVVTALRGLEGSVSGLITDAEGVSLQQAVDRLDSMRSRPDAVYRLVGGDMNIPVLLGGISYSPTPYSRDGQLVRNAQAEFWQYGEVAATLGG